MERQINGDETKKICETNKRTNGRKQKKNKGQTMKKSKTKPKYRKLLKKKDPVDKHILGLAKEGELKVGVADLNKYIKSKNEL